MLLRNPKTDKEFDSPYTDEEARELCKKGDDFAKQLAVVATLSDCQHYWLHVKAKAEPNDSLPEGAYQKLHAMFAGAKERGLKFPDIIFRTSEGTVRWFLGKNGDIIVVCGRMIVGLITVDNVLLKRRSMTERTRQLCLVLCTDPIAAAALWGQKTMTCCFCHRALETPQSVSVGYGPVCAQRWDLPWGHIDKEAIKV